MTYEQSGIAVEEKKSPIRPYRSILVPLDATSFAEAALRPAAELASRSGASLHLATVVEDVGAGRRTVWPDRQPASGVKPAVRRASDLEKELEAVRDRVDREWDCSVSLDVLSEAVPSEALIAYAHQVDADLIVAATHSRGLIARTILGSTAVDLVHAAPCPILLVPSEESGPDPIRTPLQGAVRRILVALDPDADASDPVLAEAMTLASLWDATVVLTQVVSKFPGASPGPGGWAAVSFVPAVALDKKSFERAEVRLKEMADDVRGHGMECRSEVLRGAEPAHAVFERVKSDEIDVVVVGAHDRGFLERLWSGSEADRLAHLVRSAGLMIVPLGSGRSVA